MGNNNYTITEIGSLTTKDYSLDEYINTVWYDAINCLVEKLREHGISSISITTPDIPTSFRVDTKYGVVIVLKKNITEGKETSDNIEEVF